MTPSCRNSCILSAYNVENEEVPESESGVKKRPTVMFSEDVPDPSD